MEVIEGVLYSVSVMILSGIGTCLMKPLSKRFDKVCISFPFKDVFYCRLILIESDILLPWCCYLTRGLDQASYH